MDALPLQDDVFYKEDEDAKKNQKNDSNHEEPVRASNRHLRFAAIRSADKKSVK